jgi:site-specific recombinase XerC
LPTFRVSKLGREGRDVPSRTNQTKRKESDVETTGGDHWRIAWSAGRSGKISTSKRVSAPIAFYYPTGLPVTSKNVTPHTLRHSAAMDLLQHGVDRSVIALWLGHECVETTQIYLHADLRLKEQALSRTDPLSTKPVRYRPTDSLLAFLEAL